MEVWSRDESGAESFRLFRGKTDTEWKYGNGNGIPQNGNGNGIFLTEMEMETEQRFPAEQTRKWKFRFRLVWNFRFRVDVHGPIQHAHCVALSSQTFKEDLPKIGDHVISHAFEEDSKV